MGASASVIKNHGHAVKLHKFRVDRMIKALSEESSRPEDGSDLLAADGLVADPVKALAEVVRLRALVRNAEQELFEGRIISAPTLQHYFLKLFRHASHKGDEGISAKDLFKVVHSKLKLNLSEEKVKAMFAAHDVDHDDKMSLEEFMDLVPALLRKIHAQNAAPKWIPCETERGDVYYYNVQTQATQWDKPPRRGRRLGSIYREFGAVTAEKMKPNMLQMMRKIFEQADTDRSGKLDKREVAAVIKAYCALGDDQITNITDSLDADEDGMVEWEEFVMSKDSLEKLFNAAQEKKKLEAEAAAPLGGGDKKTGMVFEFEGWTMWHTDEGVPYFHNVQTGATEWDVPAVMAPAVAAFYINVQRLEAKHEHVMLTEG